ncbi:MAG: glutamate-1-semialdehyde 2,1-aminomutase [Syntrophorhabdaceae bacterium]|nr:glutamate-1-semialdehyde 2,1-aminomutase [Syntrophorhabdaceae bacterium]
MIKATSDRYCDEAQQCIPGGVNSPVRAFMSVHDRPFFVKRAKGSWLYDVDGNAFVDYVSSWGAIILGHADEGLIATVTGALLDGTSFGACHPHEIDLARLITEAFPSIDCLRLTTSGTEATMSALRLARGYTGRNGVIKFRGCYHGHVDSLLVKAGSGLATFGIPDSAGVPADLAKHTYVAEFNSLGTVESIMDASDDIACVIVEPIMGNMGVILPEEGFLKGLEALCRRKGILLIFDEVITGFRVTFGGAQHIYDIDPDITCLGKIIGGGFPIGAFGGKRHIMERLAPLGDVYQAGTLSGNPVAVRAGLHVLDFLRRNSDELYARLNSTGLTLSKEIAAIAGRYEIPYRINSITGMFTGFFSRNAVTGCAAAAASDRDLYERFFKAMLDEGIFFAPSQFEASFVTLTLHQAEIDRTVGAYEKVFRGIRSMQ